MSKYWLGQLRHAYKNAYDGHIKQHVEFANHLLAPAIRDAEKYVTETDEELLRLREENAQLKEQVTTMKEEIRVSRVERLKLVRRWW